MTEIPDPTAFWDQKFAVEGFLYGTRPNAFLVDQAWRLNPKSRVLVPGDGEGRNGVWLARQGHRVTAVDASPRGLQKASRMALQAGVPLRTICADLRDWDWPEAAYDAVVAVYLHLRPEDRPRIHAGMRRALVPGGLILLEAFTPDQIPNDSGGPKNPDMLYTADMLRQDFDGAEIVELEETETVLDEGPGHSGKAAIVRLIARV
jgi:SAM-dependent methyltransferase